MRECACPQPSRKPQKPDTCVKCNANIGERWTPNAETVGSFFDGLEASFPVAPPWLDDFRRLCESREAQGRRLYGLRYLGRDCVRDAHEETADTALYALFEVLKLKRADEDPQTDMALIAAHHAALAYEALNKMRRKEHGAP